MFRCGGRISMILMRIMTHSAAAMDLCDREPAKAEDDCAQHHDSFDIFHISSICSFVPRRSSQLLSGQAVGRLDHRWEIRCSHEIDTSKLKMSRAQFGMS